MSLLEKRKNVVDPSMMPEGLPQFKSVPVFARIGLPCSYLEQTLLIKTVAMETENANAIVRQVHLLLELVVRKVITVIDYISLSVPVSSSLKRLMRDNCLHLTI